MLSTLFFTDAETRLALAPQASQSIAKHCDVPFFIFILLLNEIIMLYLNSIFDYIYDMIQYDLTDRFFIFLPALLRLFCHFMTQLISLILFSVSQHMLSDIDKLPGVQLGDFLLQFELDEPRESVQEIARKELRETPENVKPAVDELRRLLRGNLSSLLFLVRRM